MISIKSVEDFFNNISFYGRCGELVKWTARCSEGEGNGLRDAGRQLFSSIKSKGSEFVPRFQGVEGLVGGKLRYDGEMCLVFVAWNFRGNEGDSAIYLYTTSEKLLEEARKHKSWKTEDVARYEDFNTVEIK